MWREYTTPDMDGKNGEACKICYFGKFMLLVSFCVRDVARGGIMGIAEKMLITGIEGTDDCQITP